MTQAKQGDRVRVHYTGRLDDGTQFDSSRGREPLEVVLGSGQLIAGFERALYGMSVGDAQQVRIPPAEAYGTRRDDLIARIPRSQLPDDLELEEGLQLSAEDPDGRSVNFVVMGFDDAQVTLDANHPLSGQTLAFDIEVVEIFAAA
jgi:FKBP-type peptidyl-prolyl cis-trans isomerase 2